MGLDTSNFVQSPGEWMSKVYTTEDLLNILAAEYQACLKGQRLNLAATTTEVNPVVAPFVNTEAVQKFTAYRDFRDTIHRYQIEHQVSGIVWRQLTVKGQTIQYPEVAEQLLALPQDLEILRQAKANILYFWQNAIAGMDLYFATNHGREHRPLVVSELVPLASNRTWLSLSKHERNDFLQLVLLLGTPESQMTGAPSWLDRGSEFVCAVNPGQTPIF